MNNKLISNLCSQLIRQVRSLENKNTPAVFLHYDNKLPHVGAWEIIVRPVIIEEAQAA